MTCQQRSNPSQFMYSSFVCKLVCVKLSVLICSCTSFGVIFKPLLYPAVVHLI